MQRWAGGAAVVLVAARALAQPSSATPSVGGSGPCPEPAQVERLLRTLVAPNASPREVAIAVTDRGESYEVDVDGRTKVYADPARNCRERARVSAAFIALVLVPESVAPAMSSSASGSTSESTTPESPPPAPTAAPPAPPASATVPPPPISPSPPERRNRPMPPWARFDLRGEIEDAPELGAVGGGAMVRAAFGWRTLGAHVLCGALFSDAAALGSRPGRVSFQRWPCAVGGTLRLATDRPRLEAMFDAGLALGAVHAQGHDLSTNTGDTRLEIGARIAADLALHLGHAAPDLSPVIGIEAEYLPAPYHLSVSGAGRVAETPRAWVGFTAGLCWTVQ